MREEAAARLAAEQARQEAEQARAEEELRSQRLAAKLRELNIDPDHLDQIGINIRRNPEMYQVIHESYRGGLARILA